jgi:hypothetical protein
MGIRRRLAAAAAGAALVAGTALTVAASPAWAAPVYTDSQVTITGGQNIDAITSISAAAWEQGPVTCIPPLTPTFLGSSFNVFTVPSVMCVQFAGQGSHGPLTWHIDSETNIPPATLISIDQGSGLLTVTPTAPVITPANNQNISLTVSATDGAAKAFETLTAVPVIVAGHLTAINVTAVTDDVTLAGVNNNVTNQVDFASTPAGAALTLANAPNGTFLQNGHLVAATSRPDTYSGLSVTAADAAGATAVDTFKVEIDGHVTGSTTPQLSHGHAAMISATREWVYFVLSNSDACVHFTIVGPGAINGHEGWVRAHVGLNAAFYAGLEAHHGYTVFYQAVGMANPESCAGGPTDAWPGSHPGAVYFVSDR